MSRRTRSRRTVPGEPGRAQVALQGREVLLHQRLQRGVDHARRGAPVLAHDRVELVRKGERHLRQRLGDQLAHAQLVRGIDDRPEQADPDRLHPQLRQRSSAARTLRLIERDEDVPLGVDPLLDLECQVARDVGRRVGDLPERIELAALAQQQDVREPRRREERRARRLALDDRVRRAGCAVGELTRLPQQLRPVSPKSDAMSASASPMPSNARSSVVSALPMVSVPSSATTTSVNVPPVSTEMR